MNAVYCTKCKSKSDLNETVTINKEHYCKLCAENKFADLEASLVEDLETKGGAHDNS